MYNAQKTSFSPHAETEFVRQLARALGWTFVDLRGYAVSCGILRRIPAELACRLRCVPVVFHDRHAVLAVDDPFSAVYLSANRELLGPPYGLRKVDFVLTTPEALDACLLRRMTIVRD